MSEGDRLAAIKARLERATKRPWKHEAPALCVDNENFVWEGVYDAEGVNVEDSPANCELVAHAPDDLAWLVGEVAALEAEVARLREGLRKYGAHVPGCEWLRQSRGPKDCTCGLDSLLSAEVGDRGSSGSGEGG